ncbi:MAG: class I SAM-dependent methyltransferase [Candidatus Aminicenantes bacterium]|nr:class I SAM-dependent methyltransferase [Candidatus Aminicenantes bacterium]
MNSRNQAEKFWDRTAKNYDKEEKKDEQTYLNIIEKTRKYLKVSDIVLDYGCGTGLVSNEIAGNVKMVHAIDISSKMIEIAKNKAMGRKIQNIDYAYSTIFDDRYKKGSFNVILAFYVLHLLYDPQKVIQRMNELLKPGGLIISVTPCMGEKPILNSIFSIVSKIGIIPKIRAFKLPELEHLLIKENLEIVETKCLHKRSKQYFFVAKKLSDV